MVVVSSVSNEQMIGSCQYALPFAHFACRALQCLYPRLQEYELNSIKPRICRARDCRALQYYSIGAILFELPTSSANCQSGIMIEWHSSFQADDEDR